QPSSIPRLVRHPDLAPAVGGDGDDILAQIGVDLPPGDILARDPEVAAPPAAVEPGLDQFDVDRLRLGVGESVAHRGAPVIDRAIDLDLAHDLAVLDHAVARAALILGRGNPVAAFDFGLDEHVERVASR